MKTIYIIRHAKSSWGDVSVPDFDRSLNERGQKDAPEMAKRLLAKKIKIDAFVSSPARRAKKTCKLFCIEYDADPGKAIYVDKLYEASVHTFYEVIRALNDKYKHVAIFSHNPGITDFVNTLCSDIKIDNMPTCSIFAVEIPIDTWDKFNGAEKRFLFFDYPKA